MKPALVTVSTERVNNVATGARFRAYRLRAGVSLREIARRMGVSAPHLHNLEMGDRAWTAAVMSRAVAAVDQ